MSSRVAEGSNEKSWHCISCFVNSSPVGDLCPAVRGLFLFLRGCHSMGVTSLSQDGVKLVVRFTYLPSALSGQLEEQFCFHKPSTDLCLNIDVPLPREAPTSA